MDLCPHLVSSHSRSRYAIVADFRLDLPCAHDTWINFLFTQWNYPRLLQLYNDAVACDKKNLSKELEHNVCHNPGEMWRTLRQINPRTMKKFGLTPVQCIDGLEGPATTFAEIRSVWHDHFSKIEAAFDTSFQEILESTRLHQDSIRGSFPLDPNLLPTIPQLEQIFRNAKGNRAAGPDSLPD